MIRASTRDNTHALQFGSKDEFLCPLCKGVSNALLPYTPVHLAVQSFTNETSSSTPRDTMVNYLLNQVNSESSAEADMSIENIVRNCLKLAPVLFTRNMNFTESKS